MKDPLTGGRADRSDRREVRNPMLALPAIGKLDDLPPEALDALEAIVSDVVLDARARAQESWRKNKGPMAAYWKALGAYAHHFKRVIREARARHQAVVPFTTPIRKAAA